MKGKLVTFEGCDGVGKSTQVRLLKEYLTKNRIDFIMTREPGGCTVSDKIRNIILYGKDDHMTAVTEAYLYATARVQLVDEVILPALEQGKLVVCDRYYHSSFAYQQAARGLPTELIYNLNRYAIENCRPDLTVFLDLSPEAAFARKGGAEQGDRMERMGLSFHNKVYESFCEMTKKDDRMVSVVPNGTKDETHSKIIRLLQEKGII